MLTCLFEQAGGNGKAQLNGLGGAMMRDFCGRISTGAFAIEAAGIFVNVSGVEEMGALAKGTVRIQAARFI